VGIEGIVEGIEGVVEVPAPVGFDPTRTFVRVVEHRADGFVEFHFAIGDPALFVEMLLTEAAFHELCEQRHAVVLEPFDPDALLIEDDRDDPDRADADEWNWTMRDATHRRITELADASEHERD
jgi:phenol/toluene 2-monooxygenase (NADH) P0/A0